MIGKGQGTGPCDPGTKQWWQICRGPRSGGPRSGGPAFWIGSYRQRECGDCCCCYCCCAAAAAAMEGEARQLHRGIKGIPRTGPPLLTTPNLHPPTPPTPPPPQCQRVPPCSLGWDAFLLVPGLQKRKRRWVQKKRALPRDILQGLRVPIWLEKWSFALS